MKALLSGDGEENLDTSKWLSGLNAEELATTITTFTTTVGTALDTSVTTLSGYVTSFNATGAQLSAALVAGFSPGEVDTSGVTGVCNKMIDKVQTYTAGFEGVGSNITKGLAKGSGNSAAVQQVINEVTAVVNKAIQAAKNASGEASPSKVFGKIGRYMDEGLAIGLNAYAKVVSSSAEGVTKGAIDTAKGVLTNLSQLISDDMDADPVIRPVIDLSNVTKGAQRINGMFSRNNTISVASTRARALSGAISAADSGNRKAPEVDKSVHYDRSNSGNVTVNVDNLNTQNEDDVRTLALELSQYNRRLQFGYSG